MAWALQETIRKLIHRFLTFKAQYQCNGAIKAPPFLQLRQLKFPFCQLEDLDNHSPSFLEV